MKTKTLSLVIISPLIAFYEPIEVLILPILWLVLIDIATGMYAVRFVARKPLTSRGFFRKLPQVIMLLVALSAALHADPFLQNIGFETFQSAKLVLSFYGIYELFSILENLGKCGLPIAKQISNFLQAKIPEDYKQVIPKHLDKD